MQRVIKSFPSVAWLVAALFGAALIAHAEPIAPSGEDDTATIAAAIAAAAPDGTVELAEGTFLLSSTLTLDQGVTLKGASRDGTILDFQEKCQGFVISHEGAVLRDLTVTKGKIKATADNSTVRGGGIYLRNGLVTNCLISSSQANNDTSLKAYGGGVNMSGGRIADCEIVGCEAGKSGSGSKSGCVGNALYMTGGTATNCDIHDNDGGYDSTSSNEGTAVAGGSSIVYLAAGTLSNSRIHDNERKNIPGVQQVGGTMVNCLIYNNSGDKFAGGLYMTGGNVYYCTIYGNSISSDSSGISGVRQTKGTLMNCILVGNGPKGKASCGSINVTTSNSYLTNQYNVVDINIPEVTNKNTTRVTQNLNKPEHVYFSDPEANDFSIGSSLSSACGQATPLADVTADIVGTARDAEEPTAGAYEYVQKAGVFEVDIQTDASDHLVGDAVTNRAVIVSGESFDDVSLAWYLDGSLLADETSEELVLTLPLGRHTIKLVATRKSDGQTAEEEKANAYVIRSTVCYVNETGNGTYPYATPQTATNSLNEAIAAVWTGSDEKARIFVAGGKYQLMATVVLNAPVELVGEGRDVTFVTGFAGRAFSVTDAQAVLSGVTVTNCQSAFSISKGLIRDCRAIDLGGTSNTSGGGYYVSGGRVENCEAINCRENYGTISAGGGSYGAGLNLSAGIVSNFLCRGCVNIPSVNGKSASGGSVYATGGTLVDATIEDSCRDSNTGHEYFGANIDGSGCTLERCRFVGMRTGAGIGTRLSNVTALNCLFADNDLKKAYTNFWASGCRFVNCTIASNSNSRCAAYLRNCSVTNTIVAANGPGEEVIVGGAYSHSCAAGLEDGVDGNITADPRFRSVRKADFSLRQSSPCVNAGLKQDWMDEATDLAGNPRVRDGVPDMGCFETIFKGLMLLVR